MRMRENKDPKYVQAENESSTRTEDRSKHKRTKEAPVQEEVQPAAPPDVPLDLPDAPVDLHEPLSAEDGIDIEDTSFLYDTPTTNNTMDNDDHNNHDHDDHDVNAMDSEDASATPMHNSDGDMIDAVILMDTLQSLGVDIIQASRFVASLVRKQPTLMELYGRGSIKNAANGSHRNLNIVGKDALNLRTCKPGGTLGLHCPGRPP